METKSDDYLVDVEIILSTKFWPQKLITKVKVMYSEINAIQKLLKALDRGKK